MPLLGFLARQGEVHIVAAWLAGTLGGTAGATLLYLLARAFGEARTRRLLTRGQRPLARATDIDRVLALYRRRGAWLVTTGRCVPTVRSLVSLPAGLLPMPLGRFVLLTLLGTGLWNGILAAAGYLLGAQWQVLSPWLGAYGAAAATAVVATLIWYLWRRWRRHMAPP